MNYNAESSIGYQNPDHHRAATVLVVDDDPLMRELLTMTLRLHGHRVLPAEDGARALAIANAREHGAIDVLITDLAMPGMSGRELAEQLHNTHPEILTIFTSGYSANEMASLGEEFPEAICISKPYPPGTMEAAISALRTRTPMPC